MLRGRGGEERGSVAITVALVMTVLLGFAALVVDIGLNWAARTSAQTAADAAALAGASALVADGGAAAVLAVARRGLRCRSRLSTRPSTSRNSDGGIACVPFR